MQFERYCPPSGHPLYGIVASIFQTQYNAEHNREVILPKQNVDILFNLDAPLTIVEGTIAPHVLKNYFYVQGLKTSTLTVKPLGSVNLFGISLNTCGSSLLLPLPINELTDQIVDGTEMFPTQHFLWERVAEAQGFAKRCAIVMRWLVNNMQLPPHYQIVKRACDQLRQDPTGARLDILSSDLGISTRHLRRMMHYHLGVGPAQFIRLTRFEASLHLMAHKIPLTEVAHATRYSDQAHFCRDFKEISGMTPIEYRRKTGSVPGHLFLS